MFTDSSPTLIKPNYRRSESEAIKLLNEIGIVEPPVNPVVVARFLGVAVNFVTFSGTSENVSGLFDPRQNAIFVNRDEAGIRQTFTIAHELGHKILHEDWAKSEQYKVLRRDSSRLPNDRWEKEANSFAANLLMPRQMVEPYKAFPVPMIAKIFAVSDQVASYRLQFLYGI